jgi:hypothetical protein
MLEYSTQYIFNGPLIFFLFHALYNAIDVIEITLLHLDTVKVCLIMYNK